METLYKGRPLEIGERIPGTALVFVGTILPRRGEFQCDCGRTKAYNISQLERLDGYPWPVKSCGCGIHRRDINK